MVSPIDVVIQFDEEWGIVEWMHEKQNSHNIKASDEMQVMIYESY